MDPPMKRTHKASHWNFQVILAIVTCILGLVGYTGYQLDHQTNWLSFHPLYSTLKLFAGSYDVTVNEGENPLTWYYFVLTAAKWLALLVTGDFVIKMLKPYVTRLKSSMQYLTWTGHKTQVMIIGCNEENLQICHSADKEEECLLVCNEGDNTGDLNLEHIKWISNRNPAIICTQVRTFLESKAKHCVIIINTHDDEKNLLYTRNAIEAVNTFLEEKQISPVPLSSSADWPDEVQRQQALDREKQFVIVLDRLRIITFGDSSYQNVYQDLQARSHGVLRFTNRYYQAAFDFVLQHPLTEFMRGPRASWLDGHGCVQPDVDLQTFLIGFDAFNEEILTVSTATNQFIESAPGQIPSLKKVHYHIFAGHNTLYNKNLNHTLFRYMNEFSSEIRSGALDPNAYFPLPPEPACIELHEKSIHDASFYQEIHDLCCRNPKSVNTMIISFGSDLENLDFAHKISIKKQEWGLTNLSIYVRVQNRTIQESMCSYMDAYAVFFGQDDQVFDLKNIMYDKVDSMAYQRHLMYVLEKLRENNNGLIHTREEAETHAMFEWYTMAPSRRLSNTYGIISLRMKLHLLHLDYVPHVPGTSSLYLNSNEDYFSIYAEDDRPVRKTSSSSAEGKDIYIYEKIFPKEHYARNLTRSNLCVQEHYRWNAYLITRGFVPASIEESTEQKTKDHSNWYWMRKHGNLTTFEGLFQYRETISHRNGLSESQADVIKWDYQIMDDAWWFLHANGYDIISR